MSYLKVAKFIAGAIGVAGFFLMLSTAGTCDYMDKIGQIYPLSSMLPKLIIGLLMMFVGGFVAGWLKEKYER